MNKVKKRNKLHFRLETFIVIFVTSCVVLWIFWHSTIGVQSCWSLHKRQICLQPSWFIINCFEIRVSSKLVHSCFPLVTFCFAVTFNLQSQWNWFTFRSHELNVWVSFMLQTWKCMSWITISNIKLYKEKPFIDENANFLLFNNKWEIIIWNAPFQA